MRQLEFGKLIALLAITVLLLPFTNCDSYSNSNLFNASSDVCNEDANGNCIFQSSSLIEIYVPDLDVPTNQSLIDISGTCNHGGYTDHEIRIYIEEAGTNSTRFYPDACINGQFNVDYDVATNAGLAPTGAYELNVSIVGVTFNQSGQPIDVSNGIVSVKNPMLVYY